MATELLTPKAFAKEFSVTEQCVTRLCRTKQLKAYREVGSGVFHTTKRRWNNLLNKTKELRSDYHAAPKPKPILTLFGIDYTVREFVTMFIKSAGIMFACYFLFLGLYLVVPSW